VKGAHFVAGQNSPYHTQQISLSGLPIMPAAMLDALHLVTRCTSSGMKAVVLSVSDSYVTSQHNQAHLTLERRKRATGEPRTQGTANTRTQATEPLTSTGHRNCSLHTLCQCTCYAPVQSSPMPSQA